MDINGHRCLQHACAIKRIRNCVAEKQLKQVVEMVVVVVLVVIVVVVALEEEKYEEVKG